MQFMDTILKSLRYSLRVIFIVGKGDFVKIYINGRFLTQSITGVQRYALEMSKAIDDIINNDAYLQNNEYVMITPQNTLYLPNFKHIRIIRKGVLHGHAWEQLELPLYTLDGFLINFCGCAPLLKFNQTVTIHDAAVSAMPNSFSWAFRTWYKLMFIWLGRSLKQIFTVSEFSKKELHKYYGIPLNKLHVTYNGIDHIQQIQVDEGIIYREGLKDKKYILAVSSMNPSKNFPLILDVARLMPDTEFIIAGGSNAKVFKSAGLDVPHNAKFIGYVSDEELMALYRHASVFVYPSLYEGFGIPPLEAMMCGCPVVVSDIEVFREVYGDAVEFCNLGKVEPWMLAIKCTLNRRKCCKCKNKLLNKYKWKLQCNKMICSLKKGMI